MTPSAQPAAGWRSKRYPLHVHIGVLFTALVVLSGGVLGWYNYSQSTRMLMVSSTRLFDRISAELEDTVDRVYAPLRTFTDLFSHQRVNDARTLDERLKSLPYISEALKSNEQMDAVYVGYDDGDFFLVRPLRSAAARQAFKAPGNAAYLVQSMEYEAGRPPVGRYLYFNAALTEIRREIRTDYQYDPRTRDWYTLAAASPGKLIRTVPYLFFALQQPGVTLARTSANGHSIVAVGITLAQLSQVLVKERVTPSSQLAWFGEDGTVLAYDQGLTSQLDEHGKLRLKKMTELGAPIMGRVFEAFQSGRVGSDLSLNDGTREWKVALKVFTHGEGAKRILAIAVPMDELLADADKIRTRTFFITMLIVLLTIPLTWGLSRLISRQLRRLAVEAQRIQEFRFDGGEAIHSPILEIDRLAQAMGSMESTIRKFLEISAALASEHRFERLLERVLDETIAVATADGGMIYLLEDDDITLSPTACRWPGNDAACTMLPALRLDQEQNADNPIVAAARSGATQAVTLARPGLPDGLVCLENFFAALDRDNATLIAVPLRNRQDEIVGILCLLKAQASAEEPAIGRELVALIEALSGTSAISIDNQRLLKAQRDLLESFIKLIAGAIDSKSPYTGGHCQRVPVLTKMLAQAACDAQSGVLHDFALSEDEWEELHIAAWLHDCGKVTTPEYVVDKATKLETIHDRIHEIRMRFEVLKRDAEIDTWRHIAGGADPVAARAELEAAWRTLDEEFAFVAACNEGGEFMDPAAIARLQQIATRTWQRTLDDRIGISSEEKLRKQREPERVLPAAEPLLADRAEHITPRPDSEQITADNPWGFRLDVPQHLYNKGELYNLSIGRGTLSDEDRFKINDHIVQTIVMLSQLPFPKHLKRVPEIAGGHHEKMDGSGYPRRLLRDDMSWTARMMAIADIFEALTAVDRPYKQGKTLSEAIKIMSFMKRDQHIDPDLFELFLRSGIYRQYAEQYLRPEQIDEVDIAKFI